MPNPNTPNFDLELPEHGDDDYDIPLNSNFEKLDEAAKPADITAAVDAHEAAANPHATYLTAAEGAAAFDAVGAAAIAEAAAIAQAAADVAAHEAQADPHSTYLTSAEGDAKVTAHEAAANPHAVYETSAEVDARVATHTALPNAHHTQAHTDSQHTDGPNVQESEHTLAAHRTLGLEQNMTSGTLAARPAAATFGVGFYLATDVNGGTLYHSDATTWTQVAPGANGSEIAYAEIVSDFAVTATLADVTGLAITFTAGSRPIMLEAYAGFFTCNTIDKFARLVLADSANVQVAWAQETVSIAGAAVSLRPSVRLSLTAGTSYTYKVRAIVGSGATGVLTAAATNKAYVQAREV